MLKPIVAVLALGIGLAVLSPGVVAQANVVGSGGVESGVNDFSFDSFSADYYLGLDAQGHTTLKTVERLVARFPSYDQNHGILRLIQSDFDGHPTDVHVVSVTDGAGTPREFGPADSDEQRDDADDFYQLVSKSRNFVHGRQTYVITYTQKNVTEYFSDTKDDEFYWDTNGTGWDQDFGTVSARVHVSPALARAYNGKAACYRGAQGSSETCKYAVARQSNGGVLMTAATANLSANENMTVAIGFTPGTITARDNSFSASPYAAPLGVFAILGLLVFGWMLLLRFTKLRDAPGRGIVIAEYTPPRDSDLLTDAALLNRVKRASAAQLVDFAVRGNLRIIEGKSGLFGRKDFTIQFIGVDGLNDNETAFLQIFLDTSVPGSQYTLARNDTTKGRAVYAQLQLVRASLIPLGLQGKPSWWKTRALPFLAGIATLGLTAFFAYLMLQDGRGGAAPVLIGIALAVILYVGWRLIRRVPRTKKGSELAEYLEGLELYINLAEADRLRVLQSPTGAEQVAVSTTDRRQMVKLNEALLPYAILFSLEKEWAKEIGKYYDDSTSPEWYSGAGVFSAVYFASSIGDFASSSSSSFSGSSSSSSSGGSGGGGFSGGGGGGGGGGGV